MCTGEAGHDLKIALSQDELQSGGCDFCSAGFGSEWGSRCARPAVQSLCSCWIQIRFLLEVAPDKVQGLHISAIRLQVTMLRTATRVTLVYFSLAFLAYVRSGATCGCSFMAVLPADQIWSYQMTYLILMDEAFSSSHCDRLSPSVLSPPVLHVPALHVTIKCFGLCLGVCTLLFIKLVLGTSSITTGYMEAVMVHLLNIRGDEEVVAVVVVVPAQQWRWGCSQQHSMGGQSCCYCSCSKWST